MIQSILSGLSALFDAEEFDTSHTLIFDESEYGEDESVSGDGWHKISPFLLPLFGVGPRFALSACRLSLVVVLPFSGRWSSPGLDRCPAVVTKLTLGDVIAEY